MSLDLSAGRLPTLFVVASSPSSGRVSTAHLPAKLSNPDELLAASPPRYRGIHDLLPLPTVSLPAIVESRLISRIYAVGLKSC